MKNMRRVFLFMFTNIAIVALFSVLVFVVSRVLWIDLMWTHYWYLAAFALVRGFGGAFISLAMSRWIAKRVYRIRIVNKTIHAERDVKLVSVYETIKDIAHRRHIKIPQVGIYNSKEPNAFATWATKNKSLVAVSTALLDEMEEDEIMWVIGHEMAHVLNGDMVTMTLLQWVINSFVLFLARVIAIAIDQALSEDDGEGLSYRAYIWVVTLLDLVLWFAGMLVLMKFSRHREFRADEWCVDLLRNKQYMVKWLQKLKQITDKVKVKKDELATLKIAWGKASWFSTHPSLDARIDNLMEYQW